MDDDESDEALPTVKRGGGRPRTRVADTPEAARRLEGRRRRVRESQDVLRGRALPVATPATAPEAIPEDVDAPSDDLAAVVVGKSLRALAAGKLQPTLKDGLAAQTILDRRAEKAADRRFMLNLAQAMAGGGYAPPQKLLPAPDETVVEGDFTEVDDQNLAPAHLRSEP